ncbi:MAG: SDR family oxidoreductase [Trueperaceae bacterium]|nr:SDR family oxidoreductase [Trueperaceae bacterium]
MPTALVTGASSGIGLELARAFARRDHDLVLTARSRDALHALADELHAAHGVAVEVVPEDLARPGGPAALVDALTAGGHRIDVLVNNAGFATHGRFDDIALETGIEEARLNMLAPTWLMKRLLPGMVRRGTGGVLNVASTAGFQPGPGMAVYYATKAYVLHLSEAVAEELAGSGVTITALCPGPTESGFQARAGMEGSRLERRRGLFQHPADVAEAGVRAFERGQRVYVPGTANRLAALAPRLLPRAWTTKLIGWLHERPGETP